MYVVLLEYPCCVCMILYQRILSCCSPLLEPLPSQRKHDTLRQMIWHSQEVPDEHAKVWRK
jgi:hypothetical protein